nr:hypothetical protein [Tanacetum cinerariifolium]
VPVKKRVKIDTTNVRLEPNVPQKEETFQVIIDVIKNSTCLKAFTISAEVPEIFIQQFWHTIKKILYICPRVQEDFTKVPDDETTLTFLINLVYKCTLHKHPIMENVDYLELIWEDYAFQIDDMEKQRRRENMPYPRGKRSHGNKAVVFLKGVSDEESDDSDAKHARKRTNSRRVIKKKVLIFTDDNIIPEPDVALELGKSMSLTKATEEEAARQVHATLERIVSESNPEPARGRPLEKLAADTMQALKAGRKSIRSYSCAGGSSKGTSTKPGVTDESIVTLTTSKEESEYTEKDDDDENIQWVDTNEEEEKNDDDDDKSIDLEKTNDEFVHSEEHV